MDAFPNTADRAYTGPPAVELRNNENKRTAITAVAYCCRGRAPYDFIMKT
jgi:hypothetical protein